MHKRAPLQVKLKKLRDKSLLPQPCLVNRRTPSERQAIMSYSRMWLNSRGGVTDTSSPQVQIVSAAINPALDEIS